MPNPECDLDAYFKRAVEYPNVDSGDFESSFLITVGTAEAEAADPHKIINDNSFSFQSTGNTVLLNGAEKEVPTCDITVSTQDGKEVTLRDRVALMAFGSNSSPDILSSKFSDCTSKSPDDADAKIIVMQGGLKDHVVVESAFFSDIGPVPATIHRREGDSASVTVGFYTQEQAERLTGTEQSYDGVKMDASVELKSGETLDNPLAYVSVWGALTSDGENPIANSAIPQQTDLQRMSTMEAMELARDITDPGTPIEKYIRNMPGANGLKPDVAAKMTEIRYERTHKLVDHSLPANVLGTRIFPASINEDTPTANAPVPSYEG